MTGRDANSSKNAHGLIRLTGIYYIQNQNLHVMYTYYNAPKILAKYNEYIELLFRLLDITYINNYSYQKAIIY